MPSAASSTTRVTYATLAMAVAALALSAYSFVDRRQPADAAATPCACDDAKLRGELDGLRTEVANLRGKVALLQLSSQGSDSGSAGSTPEQPDASTEEEPKHPKFTSFELPDPSLTVTQASDGSIVVVGSDKTQTGKRVTVVAITDDGERHEVPVVVR